MFVTPAYAQAGAAAPAGSEMLISLAPFVFILVIMYVLIIRPQRQQMKKHQELIANIRRGDTVVLSSGIIGKVSKTADAEVEVEIAPGVKVQVVRSTISEVRAKGEPVKDAAKDAKDAK
ncbi:preprotein translocase subunit YajC [Methyloraptor flagellatus]|uniref:Sec translocon accessory complex subunit YajC n=1 Tax=Methyloraptor flagellatus TaxID=3162530 RepID=A0AAU7XDN9_9HYPH